MWASSQGPTGRRSCLLAEGRGGESEVLEAFFQDMMKRRNGGEPNGFGYFWIQSISSRAFLLELEPSSPKRIEVQMICAESGQTNLGDLDYEEAGSAVSVAHVSAFWWVVPAHALK